MQSEVHLFLIHIWIAFLGLFLTFYVLLDGFDLGIGIQSLFVRQEQRRGIMIASLSTIWDANETWLIVLGGSLFGAFPVAYAVVFHGLYLPIITMIFAMAFRGVAFEFREHAASRRRWDLCFGIGSLIAATCQGFALGGLISGLPVKDGDFVGGPFSWFSGFSIFVAAGVVFGYMLLGATWLIIKTEDALQARAVRMAWVAGALMVSAAIGVSVWTPLRYPYIAEKWFGHGGGIFFVFPPLIAAFCAAMLVRSLIMRQEHAPFLWTAGIYLCSLAGIAASFYPYIVPGGVTVAQAAADDLTLIFMMVGIGLIIPVMVAYNGYQYLVFRGKVRRADYD
jgi:cytochrome d ubiquinol oxidase subunit II